MLTFKNLSWLSLTLLLSSCAVGPDYVRPSAPMPTSFKEAKGKKIIAEKNAKEWKVAQPNDACDRGKWWKIFNDEKLNALEDQLNTANQNIVNAYYNYLQAYALVDEARASFFPTLAGTVSITRQKINGGTSGASTATQGSINTSRALILNASWEPDIWGLVRRQVEAASAGADASAALLASTRLLAQASLAQYYFELRGLDADQKLLDATVASNKKIVQYTKNRYTSGVDALADVVSAQSQLETARAAAINNGILRGQYEHAIAVLIGVPPGNFSLPAAPLKAKIPSIPLQVPSTLLERRPDIAQAERLMAQANAQIGVAVAAYFPTLTLSGAANAVGNNFAHLFSLPAMGWSYGPQLMETVFDGGSRSATIRAAKAGYEASVASYRQTVLAAFQDVEDNLISLRLLNEQTKAVNAAASNARLALTLTLNQYQVGTVDYASVLTAQNAAFAAEKTASDIQYLRLTAAVGLIRALGGGWDVIDLRTSQNSG